MEVVVLACIVLGLPGVGKTHLKFLLLNKLPPQLRSSTICAETPIRIEIRTISGTRVQTLEGKWSEVDDNRMIDVVARMILTVKPNLANARTKQGIFSWITSKLFQQERQERTATGARPPVLETATEAQKPTASARSESQISESCRKAMNKIMDKLVQSITRIKNESGPLSASCTHVRQQVHIAQNGFIL